MMGIVGPLLWEHLKPYRQNRLKVFLDPSVDPRGSGYHVIQSIRSPSAPAAGSDAGT